MSAGKKRYRITVQRLKTDAEGVTRAASGKIDKSLAANWTTHAARWADIEEPTGREYQAEGQVRAETTHLVAIERDSVTKAITTEMRISWNDGGTTRLLEITRILGVRQPAGGARRDLLIECKEHA
jgi:head-tail adaptor